jgi:uncharacterized protein YecT (DUF1311 family)
MTHFRALVLIVLSLASRAACAADKPGLSAEFSRCIDRSEGATFAVMDCQSAEFARQDKRLNVAYQRLLATLSPAKAEELRKVQRAWLAYAEPKCSFLHDNENFNGQMNRMMASRCAVVERARRAEELELLARY